MITCAELAKSRETISQIRRHSLVISHSVYKSEFVVQNKRLTAESKRYVITFKICTGNTVFTLYHKRTNKPSRCVSEFEATLNL